MGAGRSIVPAALAFAVGCLVAGSPTPPADGGKQWVVLVAGSEEWNNYRHQADICHAYQLVKANGVPAERIITMMVDDIAYNRRNPNKGTIINKPNGVNVYDGIVIDYKGDDVNKDNFLNVITGNKKEMRDIGSGKVVDSGPNDSIFVNFVDHGSYGLVSFPDELLYADELNAALESMYERSSYSKVLLYVEACYSGSMFDGIISDNQNVLAVTAAGPRESSYACYCKSESKPYNTCLGDLFSVTWMENVDETISDLFNKTVFSDFSYVRTRTTKSNVMMYGDFDVGREKLSAFVGSPKNGSGRPNAARTTAAYKTAVSSSDAHAHCVHEQLLADAAELTGAEKRGLSQGLRANNRKRIVVDHVLSGIYSKVVKKRPDITAEVGDFKTPRYLNLSLDVFPCYRHLLNMITEHCFSVPRNAYVFNHLQIFANLCIVDKSIDRLIENDIVESCSNIPKDIEGVY